MVTPKDSTLAVSKIDRDKRQRQIGEWTIATFGSGAAGAGERITRLLEEVIELAQAEGFLEEDVTRVARHVFAKPPGEWPLEVGGVGVTLLAYCHARGLSADRAELAECERVMAVDPEHFRARQNAKHAAGVGVLAVPK